MIGAARKTPGPSCLITCVTKKYSCVGHARKRTISHKSPLQNSSCRPDFFAAGGESGRRGRGHFWHNMISETNTITPAK